MTYSEKLKDPRWQRKRLEILQRDDFTCQKCKDKESTLHVHHRIYLKGNDPWDYPDELLVTLCENCHEAEGVEALPKQRVLIEELLKAGIYSSDMDYLGHILSEALKVLEYRDFDFLLIRISLSDEFRNEILSYLEAERANLKRAREEEDDPGF